MRRHIQIPHIIVLPGNDMLMLYVCNPDAKDGDSGRYTLHRKDAAPFLNKASAEMAKVGEEKVVPSTDTRSDKPRPRTKTGAAIKQERDGGSIKPKQRTHTNDHHTKPEPKPEPEASRDVPHRSGRSTDVLYCSTRGAYLRARDAGYEPEHIVIGLSEEARGSDAPEPSREESPTNDANLSE